MNRIALVVFMGIVLVLASREYAYAQVPGAPVVVVANTDLGTLINRLKNFEEELQMAGSLATEVANGAAIIRNQLLALQQLGAGGWDSLIAAWNDEMAAVSDYQAGLASLPALSSIGPIDQFIQSGDYDAAEELARRFDSADAIVHATDSLVNNSVERAALQGTISSQAQSAGGLVAQLQAENQSLGLAADETRDLELTVDSAKRYFVAEQESSAVQAEIDRARASSFMSDASGYSAQFPDWNALDDSLR